MFDGHDWMWGMHWWWWIFWIAIVVVIVLLLTRSQFGGSRRETPLEVLERRYAAGEISTEEYEERRARLQQDEH